MQLQLSPQLPPPTANSCSKCFFRYQLYQIDDVLNKNQATWLLQLDSCSPLF